MSFSASNFEEERPIFTTANEAEVTSTTNAAYGPVEPDTSDANVGNSKFSPLAAPFHCRNTNSYINPEVPSTSSGDFGLLNNFTNMTTSEQSNMGANRADDLAAGMNLLHDDKSSGMPPPNYIDLELIGKCIYSANYYVSLLTREQLSVLRSIRPAVLYEFLLEIARVKSEKQNRARGFAVECAFCKNNGENEEHYTGHMLKDWRGKVHCPVLRAFRCPLCGATGDNAHTIKYCPLRNEVTGSFDRSPSFLRRRGSSTASFGSSADALRLGMGMSGVNESEIISQAPDAHQRNWWSGMNN